MIVGHLGLALGARAVDPEAPLGWLVAATMAPDILDLTIAAGGYCNSGGVYTHSLVAIAATASVLGAAAAWQTRSGKTALVIAALVVSHLLADYIVGRKALWLGGPVWGFDLYRWPWADFLVEATTIAGGWWAARRWGDLPRWASSRVAVVVLILAQMGADAVQNGGASHDATSCAKAWVFERDRVDHREGEYRHR
ncbi:MAG: metal-dependent hydrolase [Gemmatimonadaceae bacterium]|nr:metal-dependent hydrolase [Gemmatimonadaceae bacterium]